MDNNPISITSPDIEKSLRNSSTVKIGVLASGEGSNFEALIKAINSKRLNATISLLIVNNNKCKAIDKAQKYNIPYVILNHKNFATREELDIAIADAFKQKEVQGIVMAGWMRIVTQKLIDSFPNRIINIHPSLLPSFKGNKAIEQALNSKVRITGCTVHYVEYEIDSGPIIIQSAVAIDDNDNYETLRSKIQTREHIILPQALSIAAVKW